MNGDIKDFKHCVGNILKHYESNDIIIKPYPSLVLLDNPTNSKNPLGRTGYYDWMKKAIYLYTTDRHIKDILRTFCHELIHHSQCLKYGTLDVTTQNVNSSDYLNQLEGEAYFKGNMLFRSWEDQFKGTI